MSEPKRMTRFEKAKVLGERASQISQGSPLAIKTNETDPLRIATEELRARKINMIISRPYPNGTKEDISVKDMIIP
jgi:DNA-directed RNA polymerase subunit K/omega